MHEVLLAETTYQRLRSEFDSLENVRYVTLNETGVLRSGGEELSMDEFDLSMLLMDVDLFQQGQMERLLEMLTDSRSLEYVHTAAAGLDSPIFRVIADKAKVFCNSNAQAPAIAEFVVASVLNRWHRFDVLAENQKQANWQGNEFKQVLGSNWLIIGFGNVGQLIARQVHGFGASITGVRRSTADNEFADRVCKLADVPDFLDQADVVVLSCSLNSATEGLVDSAFLKAMKNNAVLVNIGRGALIDDAALLAALDESEIDYAVLDVFQTEPLPTESRFWSHEKVQVTPHSSYAGSKTTERYDRMFVENLKRYVAGDEVFNLVDPGSF
jgi:phosphoglycerate dehydrogenase-like enzyme